MTVTSDSSSGSGGLHRGSDGDEIMSWRSRVRLGALACASAGAVVFAGGLPVAADPVTPTSPQCTVSNTTVTCSGDLSDGVEVDAGSNVYTTLVINDLTADIEKKYGVKFISINDDIDISIDTGSFDIINSENFGAGIYAWTKSDGHVAVSMTGDIITSGDSSDGIFVNSGGNIDIKVIGNITTNGYKGDGISATSRDDIEIIVTGDITASGIFSRGISAFNHDGESIIINQAGDITASKFGIYAFRDNDNRIDDDAIKITMNGDISTSGTYSTGIIAIAREQGDIIIAIKGDITATANNSHGITAIGFSGGDITVEVEGDIVTTGSGIRAFNYADGDITASLTGDITTSDDFSNGIFVTSRDDINIIVTGDITASGISSRGISAFNHDGGNIIINQTGDITASKFGIYAFRGIDNKIDDDAIKITMNGDIFTSSTDSTGIIAIAREQGDIIIAMKGDITTTADNSHGITAFGSGSGDITVEIEGDIVTTGSGIRAFNYAGGDITVLLAGDITTSDDSSSGITAVVNGDANAEITVNGDISISGDSSAGINVASYDNSNADINVTGDMTISGDHSDGIYARSYGSGPITVTLTGDISTSGNKSHAIYGYAGGDVDIDVTGNINTSGDRSYAVRSFSYGNSDIMMTGDITSTGYRSSGIFTYSRGDTEILVDGNITTSGYNSPGIFALSDIIINNNGNVKIKVDGDIKTSDTSSDGIKVLGAHASNVEVIVNGDISTSGSYSSDGIDIRHLYSDDNGNIDVTVAGDITTTGIGSNGIDIHAANGDASINLNGGTISAATGNGIRFENGEDNTLTINNDVTISGKGKYKLVNVTYKNVDVRGGDGNETINNYGTFTAPGSIDLGEGINVFNNMADATFKSGKSVILGNDADDLFTNWGNLSPGGSSAVQRTELTGNFVNKQASKFTVTVDSTGSDQLIVNGTARLEGGTVVVQGAYEGSYKILEASNIDGQFDDVLDTLFIDHSLNYVDETVMLSSTSKNSTSKSVSFCDFATTANQQMACQNLSTPWKNNQTASSSLNQSDAVNQLYDQYFNDEYDDLEILAVNDKHSDMPSLLELAIMSLYTPEQAQAAYDDLTGELHASIKGTLMETGQKMITQINHRMDGNFNSFDTQTVMETFDNPSLLVNDQSGFWLTSYQPSSELDLISSKELIDTDLGGILLGIDGALSNRWRFGILGSYGQKDITQPARFSSALVDTWSLGVYGGAESGASRLSFGAIYSGHAIATSRSVSISFLNEDLTASYGARSWQLFGETAHRIQAGNLALEPFAGVSSINLHTDRFSETGGEMTALTASSDNNHTAFTTLGMRSAIDLNNRIQARAMVGWRHGFGDTSPLSTLARMDTPSGTVMGSPIAKNALLAEFGLEASVLENAVLGVAYNGRHADGTTDHGLKANLKLRF